MTTFFLIRHAAHSALGRSLAGRAPGIHLSDDGRRQADALAGRLAHLPVEAVYSSPLERTRETAEPIARTLGLELQISEELAELDFGEWTGKKFDELSPVARWQQFNLFRSGTRVPGGDLMLDVQARIVRELDRLRVLHPEGLVAVVSHGDVIKAALAHYLGVHLDLFQRIEVSPASVSIVKVTDYGPHVLLLNDTGEIPTSY